MKQGSLLRIEGPLGQFFYRPDASRPALLIGGGTGYAPLKAMIREVLESGSRRDLVFYWGARTEADLYEAPGSGNSPRSTRTSTTRRCSRNSSTRPC